MIDTSNMEKIYTFSLQGDMRCCVVDQGDQYLLVCTSEDLGNGKRRSRVFCLDFKRKVQFNTLTFDDRDF